MTVAPPAPRDLSPSPSPVPEPPRGRVRGLLREYRPSVIVGSAPVAPVLVLAGVNAADELDRVAFGTLLPEIRDYFGVSITTVLTVQSMAALLPILLAVPMGFVADRVNRVRLTAAGASVWGVFSMLTAMAGSIFMLGFFRFGSGMGKVLEPSAQSLLADYYPPDRRSGIFSLHRLGNEFGLLVAPVTAGLLATWFFWQVPFLVFGIPSLLLAGYMLLRMREPVRGGQERRVLGMDQTAIDTEEEPPGWSESWRIARGVRTLRRIWMALPLLVGSIVGVLGLLALYYEEEFGLNEATRGLITSFDRVWSIVGIVAFAALGNRLLVRRPARVLTYAALLSLVPATAFLVVAMSPWLGLSVGALAVSSMVSGALGPAFVTVMTLTIPPRVRSFAVGAGALFVAPGLFVAPLAGWIADSYGLRAGIALFVPVFLAGAAIIGSAATTVEADIRAATAAAAAALESRRSREEGETKLLVCRDLDVHYGQVQILFNVDFEITEGEIVAMLGTNGAGKSTLLNAISGLTTASNGAIFFDGDDITFLPPAEHVDRGLVMVPGGKGVFPTLTVRENLQVAEFGLHRTKAELDEAMAEVFEMFPILQERIDQDAGSLSGGQQQMLTLAQAFLARPRLLMIDELSLGLAPTIVEQLLEVVRAIRANGTTVILVEQSVNVALTIADRAVFMEKGEIRFSGPAEELLHRGDILRSVFLAGSGVGSAIRHKERLPWDTEPEIVLEVNGLSRSFGGIAAVSEVDLTLRDGEVLGIIGPNGAGKTTLFDLITGYTVPDSGTVALLGEDVTELSPDERSRRGLQRSFQDARLFPALTVEENLLYALDRHLAVRNPAMGALHLPRSRKAEQRLRKRAERIILLLNLEPFRDKFVRELSTGSRRLVDLGCIMATDPQVLLLDEPSSGVAQKETEELGPLLQRIKTETACSVLIIEHDMSLLTNLSDELVALHLGRNVTRGPAETVLRHPVVVESYLGNSDALLNRSGSETNGATQ